MQYCECTNDFVNAIIDDYFNSFEIRKYYINKYEQPYYAVRISKLVEDDTGKVKRKYTYLAYFAKPEMAYTYLAEYNSGAVVPEHIKYSDSPTFAEMYEKWKKYRKSLKNQISDSTWRNYEIAFHHFSELHDRKFISIRTNDLQQCLNAYNHKWQTHTFASLMDNAGANDVCIKLIMGHSMKNDTTKGTYTHKTLEELLTEVNKI